MPTDTNELANHLIELEQKLLESAVRQDSSELASLLAEDFREFGVSGRVYTRQQIIAELAKEPHPHLTMSNPTCLQLADDVVLLNYRSTRTVQLEPSIHANRSSLWVKRDGRWQMVFHQGTRV